LARTAALRPEADALRAEADQVPGHVESAGSPESMIHPPVLDEATRGRLDSVLDELTDPANPPTAARRTELLAEHQMISEGGAPGSELEQARSESQRSGLLTAAARIDDRIRELREGQPVSLGPRYITTPAGSPDLGRIDGAMAAAIGRDAAPIRLTEHARSHIGERQSELAAHGYAGPADFVRGVAANFSEIWSAGGRSLMLVQRVQDTAKERAHSLFVLLNPSTDGRAYEVQSGGVFRAAYPRGAGRKLLWRGERANIAPTGTDSRMPITNPPGHEAGTGDAGARNQSDGDVSRSAPARNDETSAAFDRALKAAHGEPSPEETTTTRMADTAARDAKPDGPGGIPAALETQIADIHDALTRADAAGLLWRVGACRDRSREFLGRPGKSDAGLRPFVTVRTPCSAKGDRRTPRPGDD
jgi:hypothetical protein